MSDPENFLARWSRRKREIEQHESEQPDQTSPGHTVPAPSPARPEAEAQVAGSIAEPDCDPEAFDPASLPPLDSITAESDISGYFARGVPAELVRAALRRVWTSDPAIRDFVGLSENAWDFNAPETIPGFGPITASDDVAGMMRQMMGEARETIRQSAPEPSPVTAPQASEVPEHLPHRQVAGMDSGGDVKAESVRTTDREPEETQSGHEPRRASVSMPEAETETTESANTDPTRVRTHGGALPK
jgi:hypothetical protein